MSSWRYVAARERQGDEDIWTVRELYDDDGKLSWSAEPMAPQGDGWMDLADDCGRMNTGVLAARFLDLTLDPPALVERGRRRKSCPNE